MPDVTLSDIANLQNESTATSIMNANSALIEEGLADSVNVAGDTMEGTLDMNSHRIINLPEAVNATEPVRKGEFDEIAGEFFLLDALLDVSVPSPSDNQVLTYNETTELWEAEDPQAASAAPTNVDYLVKTADATLTAERVVTDTASVIWDWATAAQAKATVPDANSTTKGLAETATDAEVQTGTDTARYITPAGLAACTATTTRKGVGETSTDAEARARTSTAVFITPSNLAAKSGFHAHLGGIDPNINVNTLTRLEFNTELYDTAGDYDTTNYRWTPPASRVQIIGHMYVGSALNGYAAGVFVYKNGVLVRTLYQSTPGNNGVVSTGGTTIEVANGTDYYEIWVYLGGPSGVITLSSIQHGTYFMGIQI